MRDIDIPYMSHTLSISLPSNLTVNCTSKINLTYSKAHILEHSILVSRAIMPDDITRTRR